MTMWTEDIYRPTSIYIDAEETVYITELSPEGDHAQMGGKISIWDIKGNNLTRWDAPSSHWVYGDSRGDLYVAEDYAFKIKKYVRKG